MGFVFWQQCGWRLYILSTVQLITIFVNNQHDTQFFFLHILKKFQFQSIQSTLLMINTWLLETCRDLKLKNFCVNLVIYKVRWRMQSAEKWSCFGWTCPIVVEDGLASSLRNHFSWTYWPFLGCLNSHLVSTSFFATSAFHSFELPNFLQTFLSKWRIHSSQLFLHPPELGSVALNT